MAKRIELAEVLKQVRLELIKADHDARAAHASGSDAPVMQFAECELEFNVEYEDNATGGFNIYVVKLSGGVKQKNSDKIKIKYVAISGSNIVAAGESVEKRLTRPGTRGVRESK